MRDELTSHRLSGGVWEATLTAPSCPARVALCLHGRIVALAEVAADGPNSWRIRAALPAETISDGVQTYLLIGDDGTGMESPQPGGVTLGRLPMLAGSALSGELLAEIDLLRAELDLLKREFRRLATDG